MNNKKIIENRDYFEAVSQQTFSLLQCRNNKQVKLKKLPTNSSDMEP